MRRTKALWRSATSPAAEQREGGGDPAADHEAGHGRAHERPAPVLRQLAAPVGQLGHLGAQVVDPHGEVAAGLLDRRADHVGALRRHQLVLLSSWSCSCTEASSCSRVFLASSIAMSGVGGAPFLNRRIAISAAMMASRKSSAVTSAKPTQTLSSWLS